MEELISPTEAVINGRRTILAGTNNYLGLTFEPEAVEAACAALRREGTGTTGSRIANGTYRGHEALEEAIANALGRRRAMVFTTGYQANLGTIAGLAGPKDVILLDADCHASIYDGCRLSNAELIRFRHNDPADLDKRLARLGPGHSNASNKLIIVEGVYSMFGDTAPLKEIAEVKRRHNAYLLVDEAHSYGVYGAMGRGLAEAEEVSDAVDFVVGTFSKSLGATGGFCASDHPAFDLLRIASRPYMYTASLPPAVVASVQVALRRIQSDPDLRARLWDNVRRLYDGLHGAGFTLCAAPGPVVAVRAVDPAEAVRLWRHLIVAGVYVNLAIPPGTPGGAALLRCSVSAAHSPAQLEAVVAAFEQARAMQAGTAQGDARSAL
jgi:8-amino-7-oxononanoate synthase